MVRIASFVTASFVTVVALSSLLLVTACEQNPGDEGEGEGEGEGEAEGGEGEGGEGEGEGEAGEGEGEGEGTCGAIEAQYANVVSAVDCDVDADCQILTGQCGVGLGGCYEVTNTSVTQEQLNTLGDEYADGGCTSAVCDCAAPPASAVCGAALGGTCVAAGDVGSLCDLDADCNNGLRCSCFNDACGDCGAGGDPGGTCETACLGG